MSTKKSKTAAEPTTTVDEEAVITESPPEPSEELAEEIHEKKPVEEDGFCVYLGPSIRGVIKSGTVFGMPKDQAVASLSAAAKAYPLIPTLIIPGGSLPEARIMIKTPGNALSVSYDRLVAAVTKK